MRRIIAACTLVLAACASTAPKTEPKPISSLVLKLSPASLERSLQLSQQLSITYNGQTQVLDGLLEANPSQIQVALVKFGRRVVTLRYDGIKLESTKDAMVPKEVEPERILSDLQLVYWPLHSIVVQLPAGYQLRESRDINGTGTRTLSFNQQAITQIQYNNPQVTLQNLQFNYSMTIVTQ